MPSLMVFIAPLALAAATPQAAAPGDGAPPAASAATEGETAPAWSFAGSAVSGLTGSGPQPGSVWQAIAEAFRAPAAQQVRIEQRLIVRVAPRPPVRAMLADLPSEPLAARYAERKVGKCLKMSGIAGVQIGEDDRLLLFMRDQRLIGASLEKACQARDFYSGFYVERSSDGRLCVNRDMLHARSGTTCSLSRLRQLVAVDD